MVGKVSRRGDLLLKALTAKLSHEAGKEWGILLVCADHDELTLDEVAEDKSSVLLGINLVFELWSTQALGDDDLTIAVE